MQLISRPRPYSLVVLSLAALFVLSGCKTSGEIAKGPTEDDPSGVVTVDAPADITPTQAPVTVPNTSHSIGAPVVTQAQPSVEGSGGGPLSPTQEIAVLRGRLEDSQVIAQRERDGLNAKIKELEEQNRKIQEEYAKRGATPPAGNGPAPVETTKPGAANGAALLWQSAQKDINAGEYEKALSPLNEIVKSYPKNELAMPALVNVGVIQYQLTHFNDAAITFNSVIDKYGKKKEAALAWFGQAAAFARLKQKDESKLVFEEVVQRFPASAEAKSAKAINAKKETVPNSLFPFASKYRSLKL